MKILRKNDDFRKMPEKCIEDILAIKSLINQGWNYCAKEVYKEFYKSAPVKVKEKEEKPVKEKKEKKGTQKEKYGNKKTKR